MRHVAWILRLSENPHHLGIEGFAGHVVALEHQRVLLEAVAHRVDREIRALVLHLGGDDDELARRRVLFNNVQDALVLVSGQTADAEALHDEGVVFGQQVVQQPRVEAGNHLHQCHLFVEPIVEQRPVETHRRDVAHKAVVKQNAHVGVVDARKGGKALGTGLARVGAEDDPAAEDDVHPGKLSGGRTDKGVHEVQLGVGGVIVDGLLRAGEDNGLIRALHQIAQSRGGISHGVRAVADYKAVVPVVVLPDRVGDAQPVGGGHVGRVDAVQAQAVHAAEIPDCGHIAQKLRRRELGRQAVRRHLRGDGPAGADHEDVFHGAPPPGCFFLLYAIPVLRTSAALHEFEAAPKNPFTPHSTDLSLFDSLRQ